MNFFTLKTARGRLYHSPWQSLSHCAKSLLSNINSKQEVLRLEASFAKYCGRKYAVAFPKARTVFWFYLQRLNLDPGAKILMPSITIKGMLDVVMDHQLYPIYVDLELDSCFPSLESIKQTVELHSIKAALLTPLFGLSPQMEEIVYFLSIKGIKVIIDFSQCLNCTISAKPLSSYGDLAIYSSSSIKTLDALGGGLALTNSKSDYEFFLNAQESLANPSRSFLFQKSLTNLFRNMATSQPLFSIFTFWLIQLLSLYIPNYILRQTGTRDKSRLTILPSFWFEKFSSVQASIALKKLPSITYEDQKRIRIASLIIQKTDSSFFLANPNNNKSVYWQLLFFVDCPLRAFRFFARKNIDIASTSLSLISSLSEYPGSKDLQNSHMIYHKTVFIPCYPSLKPAELNHIIQSINEYNNDYRDRESI